MSRHLYDVYHLSKARFAEKAITNQQLYETIVLHRYTFTRVGGVNYNNHNPKFINPIPPSNIIFAWEIDYNAMLESMIYGDKEGNHDHLMHFTKALTGSSFFAPSLDFMDKSA